VTLFEYVAVAASLLCSFTAARLLGGIAAAFQPGPRYWIHAGWVCLAVVSVTTNWWLFWSYHEVDWNYWRFLVALLPLVILYVLATVLVPAGSSEVRSWRDHYFEVRRRFFLLNIGYVFAFYLATVVLLGHPVLHYRRVIPASLLTIFTAGLVSDAPRLQTAVFFGFVTVNTVAAVLFQGPGDFNAPF
jgi:hypothetical protein